MNLYVYGICTGFSFQRYVHTYMHHKFSVLMEVETRLLNTRKRDRQTFSWVIYSTLPFSLPVSWSFLSVFSLHVFYSSKFVSCVKMSHSKISIACLIAPMRSTSLVHIVFLISSCLRMVEKDKRLRSCLLCSIYPAFCVQILRVIVNQLETLTFT
jgi:hypothetical protein